MTTALRTLVSHNRRRFHDVEGDVDLDLSYITDRLIAMGYPAANLQALFRNDVREVKKFLDSRHLGQYKVYNLCSGHSSRARYPPSVFEGRLACYSMPDHSPPPFHLIEPFCRDVTQWLQEHSGNVAVVHCKAGKGRTGTMICCYLIFSGMFNEANDAMEHFGRTRTKDGRGVTIPSQVRYIRYFQRMVRDRLQYHEHSRVRLSKVALTGVDPSAAASLIFEIGQRRGSSGSSGSGGDNEEDEEDFVSAEETMQNVQRVAGENDNDDVFEFEPSRVIELCGDVKVKVVSRKRLFGIRDMSVRTFALDFHFFFNTFFLDFEESEGGSSSTTGEHVISSVLSLRANELDELQMHGGVKDKLLMKLHFQAPV